jgi:uncharacterized protein (TIGR02117 family)
VLLLSACSTKPHVLKHTSIEVESAEKIYIVRHGWHTGFVIPADIIQAQLPQLVDRFSGTPYLEFGWGDKDYYQNEKVTLGLALKAMFLPTDSVMHVVAVPERADLHFTDNDVEPLCLDREQYALLIGFIEQSFLLDDEDLIIKSQSGNYGDSQFYMGEGKYYLMNTCNNWTARGLKSVGLPISPGLKTSAGSIMKYLQRHNGCPLGASASP